MLASFPEHRSHSGIRCPAISIVSPSMTDARPTNCSVPADTDEGSSPAKSSGNSRIRLRIDFMNIQIKQQVVDNGIALLSKLLTTPFIRTY
jgi:hypothetical protein